MEMKKIIVVCDKKKNEKYYDFLNHLVNLNDDFPDEIIGTKDGSIYLELRDEEEMEVLFKDKIQSFVIFINPSKDYQEKLQGASVEFDDLGMSYGWIGKHGYLKATNKSFKEGEIERFESMAEKLDVELKKKKEYLVAKILLTIAAPTIGTTAFVADDIKSKEIRESNRLFVLIKEFYLNGLQKFVNQ